MKNIHKTSFSHIHPRPKEIARAPKKRRGGGARSRIFDTQETPNSDDEGVTPNASVRGSPVGQNSVNGLHSSINGKSMNQRKSRLMRSKGGRIIGRIIGRT